MIYFDNAATTYPKPQCVYDALNEGSHKYMFNAGRGSYAAAKETFKMIDATREKVATVISANKEKVIFTSSATESLDNIIYGLQLKEGDNVYVSPFEHNAVVRPLKSLNVNLIIIPFDKETWQLKLEELNDIMLLKAPKCVIISHISNTTGFELPYEEIFEKSKKFGSINVLDSAQGFGVYPINKKNIDYLVFAGHKSLYGSFGVAGFIKLSNDELKPYKIGGTGSDSLNFNMPAELPNRYEAGSMNSLAIYSIFSSIDFLKKSNFVEIKHDLSDYLIKSLEKLDNVIIYCPKDYVTRGIVSFNVSGYTADEVGTILSEDFDICVRTGYHCCPFVHEFIDSLKYSGTVRVSLSGFNTKEEIDTLINALKEM